MKAILEVSEFHRPNEAAEVKHVVERQTGRRSFLRGPGWRAGEAVPKTGGEHCRENGQHQDVTQLPRPGADGPAEAGDERQNTGVEENVQLEEKGEGVAAREGCEECVLFRRYCAALFPLI